MAKKKCNRNSKVIRVSNELVEKLARYKAENTPWSDAIEALLERASGTTSWVLPSSIFDTKTEATRIALELAAQQGLDFEERETPIKIKRI